MPLDDQQIRGLLIAIVETHAAEIDCEQFLHFMAEYAEARAEGRPLRSELAMVEAHERLCGSCREECNALVDLLRADAAETPHE
jgi:hypothetical protein